jgi:hypothetical protein
MDGRAVPLLPPVPTAASCSRLTVLAVAAGAAGETAVEAEPAMAAAAVLPVADEPSAAGIGGDDPLPDGLDPGAWLRRRGLDL